MSLAFADTERQIRVRWTIFSLGFGLTLLVTIVWWLYASLQHGDPVVPVVSGECTIAAFLTTLAVVSRQRFPLAFIGMWSAILLSIIVILGLLFSGVLAYTIQSVGWAFTDSMLMRLLIMFSLILNLASMFLAVTV